MKTIFVTLNDTVGAGTSMQFKHPEEKAPYYENEDYYKNLAIKDLEELGEKYLEDEDYTIQMTAW